MGATVLCSDLQCICKSQQERQKIEFYFDMPILQLQQLRIVPFCFGSINPYGTQTILLCGFITVVCLECAPLHLSKCWFTGYTYMPKVCHFKKTKHKSLLFLCHPVMKLTSCESPAFQRNQNRFHYIRQHSLCDFSNV